MRLSLLQVSGLLFVFATTPALAVAQHKDKPAKAGAEAKDKAGPAFAVVRVGDAVKVMPAGEVAAMRKKLADDYKSAKEQYDKAKAQAAKDKTNVTMDAPHRPDFKVLGSSFKTEKDAQEYADKHASHGKEPAKRSTDHAKKKDKPKRGDKKGGGR